MKPYPLQVSMHHVNAVHVLQSICGIDQLNESVTSVSARFGTFTHELDAINPLIVLYELVDAPVVHPL